MKKFLGRNKVWIAILVIALLGTSGYYAYEAFSGGTTEMSDEPELQTAVARLGDLTVFASAAGQVIPAAEVDVGFDESGTLSEVLVQVGEEVQTGQILARLETGQSEQDIELSIAEAQLNLLKARQELDDIYTSAEMDAALALQAVEAAQGALEDLLDTELQQAQALQSIAEAEEAVAEAQRNYNSVRAQASQSVIDAAYADLVLAESQLKDAQKKFNEYADKPDENLVKANLQLKLSNAQGVYDSALRYYNAVTSSGSELDRVLTEAELATAQAQLQDAQRGWERIKDGPTPGEVALAEAELAAAEAEWEILQQGPDPEEIALAEANLASAEAEFVSAKDEQAVIDLVAPMDGTILSFDASVGEKIGTSAIITLADLSQPFLEVYLDETDLDKVAVGFEIEVVFDAFPDDLFSGRVVQVDPSLQTVSNVQVIRVLAQLDAESFAKPQSIPVGLNASVDVIGGRSEGAVLVPVEALREIGPDEYAVFVMEDGEPKLRVVTVGLMDFTSAEIISGLEVGEIVTTGIVETN